MAAGGVALGDEPVAGVLPDQEAGDEAGHQDGNGCLDDGFAGRSHGQAALIMCSVEEIFRRRAGDQYSAGRGAMPQK